MRKFLAIIGRKATGKTLVAERLISYLTKKGYRITFLKSVHHEEFTIDSAGKDTWRAREAGADSIICVAPKELTVMRRIDTRSLSLEQIMEAVGPVKFDLAIMEGFHWLIGKNSKVYKIVTSRKVSDSADIVREVSQPVLAITYIEDKVEIPEWLKLPTFSLLKEADKLCKLVEESLLKKE